MNKVIEGYRNSFLSENSHEIEYLSNEEYKTLYYQARDSMLSESGINPLDDIEYDYEKKKYYRIVPAKLNREDISELLQYKTLEALDKINRGINGANERIKVIKGILVFFCVLVILSIVGQLIWGAYILSGLKGMIH